jgi:hypothetical protein
MIMSNMTRISRREFLRLSAGAAAGLALSGSVVPIVTKAPEIKTLPLHFQPGDVAFAPQAVALERGGSEEAGFDVEPNAIEIRRVIVRPEGELNMDDTLNPAEANEIVVEWEAGATANAKNTPGVDDIFFQIVIWNHTDGVQAASISKEPEFTDGRHESGIYELIHRVGAASGVFALDKMYEITTCLYRAPNIASFYRGPMFYVITP